MKSKISAALCVIAGATIFFMATAASLGDPPDKAKDAAEKDKPAQVLPTVAEARSQAKLLHTTYESALIAVHRAYFQEGKRMVVPSRVLEDVFYWVDHETKGETRWISVNTEAMNIDNEPDTEIEKAAAKALASGKEEFEVVEDGVYHRAGAITLVAACLRCHESSLSLQRKRKRVAGLVISLPVKPE